MPRNTIKKVTVRGTFMATWVSSGLTPGTLALNVYDGNETLVATPVVVSSGDGHYYAEAIVNTAGFYSLEWYASIYGKDYRDYQRVQAVTGQVD